MLRIKPLPGVALDRLRPFGIEWVADADGITLLADGMTHPVATCSSYRAGMPTKEMLEAAGRSGRTVLFTSFFVSPRLAPKLRAAKINYVDMAGNASVRLPGLIVESEGRPRLDTVTPPTPAATRTKTGLRVSLALLRRPDEAGRLTVREVATAAGVSTGAAQSALRDLRESRHLSDRGLRRTSGLVDAWVEGYRGLPRMREPVLRLGHRSGWHEGEAVRAALQETGASLGGEDAAEMMRSALRGTSGVIFASRPITPVVVSARLSAEDAGELVVRPPLWGDHPGLLAPSPVVYADLLISEDPRQFEAAEQLRGEDALLRRLDEG